VDEVGLEQVFDSFSPDSYHSTIAYQSPCPEMFDSPGQAAPFENHLFMCRI
jgi:hypothetical protein